jgi:hypothetical protein
MSASLAPTAEAVSTAIPRIADGVETLVQSDGVVHLRGPELRRGRVSQSIAWFFRLPGRVEVALDPIGTWVVEHMDGRNLDQLADALAAWGKLTRREAEAALTAFIKSLLQRRLIRLDGLFESSP